MAQKQKAGRQHHDSYAQRGKTLASQVQRLRGWVGTDSSRVPELADALVQLTAHRLLGHGYTAAAADAQEAAHRAGQLLTANGPIGPYTSAGDAGRYLTAIIQLATVQVGLGMTDAAGRTINSLEDVREQLRAYRLNEQLEPRTAIWALWCTGRATLASGDVAAANAYADAALDRLAESGLRDDPDAAYLDIDVGRLASDCRWAAGRSEEAIIYLHAAMERYEGLVDGRFEEPARLSPALVERLAEPLFGLYRDMADRLEATGDVDLGLITRHSLIDVLRRLAEQLGNSARVQLASALVDLSADLLRLDRIAEADAAADEASAIAIQARTAVHDLTRAVVSRSTRSVTWAPLPSTASYAATTAASAGTVLTPGGPTPPRPPGASGAEPAAFMAERRRRTAAWLEARRPEAHRLELDRLAHARLDAERREAERIAAERAAANRQAAERAAAQQAERLEAERRAAAEEAERIERKRRRAERIEAHRLEVERREAERREAERKEAERREAERREAER
jgi:hypothetical protein